MFIYPKYNKKKYLHSRLFNNTHSQTLRAIVLLYLFVSKKIILVVSLNSNIIQNIFLIFLSDKAAKYQSIIYCKF